METVKTIALTFSLLIVALFGGDLWIAYFGSQALQIILNVYEIQGPSPVEFFAIWFVADLLLSTIVVNQWAAATETVAKADVARTLIRRAATIIGYKVLLGPLALGISHAIAYYLPSPF